MTTPDKEEMPIDRTAFIAELTGEGPIFRDDRFAARLSVAANAYLDDYVYSPEEFVADHEPTEFERQLISDFIAGLFADETFSGILHSLIEKSLVRNAYEPLKEALEKVMVGGNHLGLIIGADHPPHTASHEEARTHYADAIWTYEAWCCWKTIMEARPALSTLPVNDRHHSGSDNERLRKALSKIEVWADDRSHLNNVFETITDAGRAALSAPSTEKGR